jgi:hypothetical protein
MSNLPSKVQESCYLFGYPHPTPASSTSVYNSPTHANLEFGAYPKLPMSIANSPDILLNNSPCCVSNLQLIALFSSGGPIQLRS